MAKTTKHARDYPQTAQLPPLSEPGNTRVVMDGADARWKASENTGPYLPILPSVRQTVDVVLAANRSTGISPPNYAPFLTAPALTTITAASRLRVDFYAVWRHTGPMAVVGEASFRVTLNAVPIAVSRATSSSKLRDERSCVSLCRVLAVSAGVHTIGVEWSGALPPGNILRCQPVTFPDFEGAQLIVQEVA